VNHTQVVERNIEHLPVIYLTKTMTDLYRQGKNLPGSDHASILIAGERGTGKELLAKSIHYNCSPEKPFITINCVNLSFEFFEEKIRHCLGHACEGNGERSVAAGNRGATLFLRDVGRLDKNVQRDLLGFLKEMFLSSVQPGAAGSSRTRIIFSYEQNGETAEARKLFGRTAYTVFNPYLLSIMPLRNRPEDIQPLALFFVDEFSKEYDKDVGGIHSAAMQVLSEYSWPGNVSELRDVIENAVLLCQSPLITRDDIRFNISKKSIALESFLSREDFFTLEELDKVYIQTVLRRVKNNKSKAAKILGISRNTLQRRLDSFIEKPAKKKTRKKSGSQPQLF